MLSRLRPGAGKIPDYLLASNVDGNGRLYPREGDDSGPVIAGTRTCG